MRIGIDARFYGSLGKGLGRYTQKLIEGLEEIDGKNEYYVFLRAANFDEYAPENKNFHKVLADFQWYTFVEQVKLPLLLRKYKLDLVHFPHFNVPLLYRRPFVVTIHDLILLHFPTTRGTTLPSFFYWFKFLAYRLVIWSAIGRAQAIFAVSNFTKDDIVRHYPRSRNKITVTYEAVDGFCRRAAQKDAAILEKYGIIKPYLLYVGNAYPHKNLERLIEVFPQILAKNQTQLVLVGAKDYFYRRLIGDVEKSGQNGIVFCGYVPDEELDAVYKNCEIFVMPSLYEGFGLPPLEAMAKGAPVISADHPCMREVLGNSARFFNPYDSVAIKEAVAEIFGDENVKNRMRNAGFKQISRYSWKRMAEKTQAAYECLKI